MNEQHQLEAGFDHELTSGGVMTMPREAGDAEAEQATEKHDVVWRGAVGEKTADPIEEIKPGDPDYIDLSHINGSQERVTSGKDFDPLNAEPKWRDDA